MHRWVIAMGAVLLCASIAHAQPSNFGTVTLQAGFMPDPHQTGGTSGGANSASQLNSSCRGWISATPDHIVVLRTPFRFIRMFADRPGHHAGDQSMANGQTWCNDDTYGTNPSVEGSFAAGTYRVWVGSYRQGENARYTLKLTELAGVTPGGAGGGPTAQPGTGTQPGTGGGVTGVIPGTGVLDLVGRRGNFRGISPAPATPRRCAARVTLVHAQQLGDMPRLVSSARPHPHRAVLFNFCASIRSNADTTLACSPDRALALQRRPNGTNPAIDIAGAALVRTGSGWAATSRRIAPYRSASAS
jgi:hypothetical protein